MARQSQQGWNGNSRSQYQSDIERGSPKRNLDNFNEASKALVGGMASLFQPGSTPDPSFAKNPYLPKDGILGKIES